MKTSLVLVFCATSLAGASAHAMGAGHHPLRAASAARAVPAVVAAARLQSCRAVPLPGTAQRAGVARGSCSVVAQADLVAAAGGGIRTRTLMRGGRTAQTLRVAAAR